jgi:CubicO group peptidase (beta-lactamase class C family)
MVDTGLHEELADLPDDRIAIGYEGKSVGERNSPKYWGRTSWLVMGSGGMQSTPMDLYRWLRAIREGTTLTKAGAAKYGIDRGGMFVGGDERGFLCMYASSGDDLVILCSNAHSRPGDRAWAIGRRLVDLVRQSAAAPFTLGIEMKIEAEGKIAVARIVPGSAAERDGLMEGDVLLTANGQPMRDPVASILGPLLKTGAPVTFAIDRAGSKRIVVVKPEARTPSTD